MKSGIARVVAIVLLIGVIAGCTLSGSSPEFERTAPGNNASPSALQGAANPGDAVVAVIKDECMTRSQLETAYQEYLSEHVELKDSGQVRSMFQDDYILRRLIICYARDQHLDDDQRFKARLRKVREDLLFETGRTRLVSDIEMSESEVKHYYEEHREEFTQREKIQVRHILTTTYEETEKALERIRNGESFGQVAAEVSVHGSRISCGELPVFSRGTYTKTFEDTAFALPVGRISGIVKTELGYHIIQKTGETPSRMLPFEEVRERIRLALLQNKEAERLEQFRRRYAEQIQMKVVE